MKRWILSKIVADEDPEFGVVYRMAIQRYQDFAYAFGEVPVDPETGIPTNAFGFALVASKDMARFRNDLDVDVLPDFPLDGKVSALHQPTKVAMRGVLEKHGLPVSLADNADGFRDVVRGIGRAINPAFDEDRFDVSE